MGNDTDIDDFLNLEEDSFLSEKKVEDTTEDTETTRSSEVKSVNEEAIGLVDEDLPQLCGSGYPEDFLKMVDRVHMAYKILPKLQYNLLYRELSDLSITSSPTPTLQVLNDEIQKVQAAKDRLSEIMVKVLECHNIKKRLLDTLLASWGKFTSEKNAEARKGDGEFRLSSFSIDFAKTESLLKVCTHILKNLDSLHDSLSRRITINQLLLKMNDMGRGSLPDFYKSERINADNDEDIFDKKEIDPSESLQANEESWD